MFEMSNDKNNQHTWLVTKKKMLTRQTEDWSQQIKKNNLKNVLTARNWLMFVSKQTQLTRKNNRTKQMEKKNWNHSEFHTRFQARWEQDKETEIQT